MLSVKNKNKYIERIVRHVGRLPRINQLMLFREIIAAPTAHETVWTKILKQEELEAY